MLAVPRGTQFDLPLGFDAHSSTPFRKGQMLAMLSKPLRPSAPAAALDPGVPGPAEAARAVDRRLDPAALARLIELDPTGENRLLERVLKAFQTSVARLRPQADSARAVGDAAVIRLVVHTLKSSSASIGALQLSQLCAEIETVIRLEPATDLGARLDALDLALDDALHAIGQRLAKGTA